jgi:hypothetical protein
MEPLLVYPDPAPPELVQALELSGYPWKSIASPVDAVRGERDDGWAVGLIVV